MSRACCVEPLMTGPSVDFNKVCQSVALGLWFGSFTTMLLETVVDDCDDMALRFPEKG